MGKFVPWKVQMFLLRKSPRTFQLLRYGLPNINTPDHWSEAWGRHGQSGYRATGENAEIRTEILRTVPSGSRVLDVGCGVGEIMELLRDRLGCECSGVDIAPTGIEAVKKKGMEGKVACLPEIPFADGAFSVALMTETLEHVTEAEAAVDSVWRVLAPGGLLLVSVPDGEVDDESTHVHRFTSSKLRALLARRFAVEVLKKVPGEKIPSLLAVVRKAG